VTGTGAAANVSGLAAAVSVAGTEAADELAIRSLGGTDTMDASAFTGTLARLTLDGGNDPDTLTGSAGVDRAIGGTGNDTAFLGEGSDDFVWNTGDGTDTVEGQGGSGDRLLLGGSEQGDTFELFPNATRLGAVRNAVSAVDGNGFETVDVTPLGGIDTVTFGNLTGTAVTKGNVSLGAGGGATGDGAADTVNVTATNGVDDVDLTGDAAAVNVAGAGITPPLTITGSDGTSDAVTVNLLGAGDTLDASTLAAGAIGPRLNGGLGEDIFLGGPNPELINGGDGNDTAFMGPGDDTFTWNPGDDNDIIEGQTGAADKMLFNGAMAAEQITMSANGGRLLFFRDIAAVTMDTNDVEVVDFNASGAADVITINNLAPTDVRQVNLDLALIFTTNPDGNADNIDVHGTDGDDPFVIAGDTSAVNVTGIPTTVSIPIRIRRWTG
jgi:hypothetical protein